MGFRAGLVLGSCAFALAALAGCARSRSSSPVLPPPSFRPAPGWVVLEPGPAEPNLSAQMVVAVTASDAAALRPFAPFAGFRRLRPRGIIVWATTLGRGGRGPTSSFPRARWPLALSAFRLDRGWEGQPAANIQQRLRWAVVRGWHLDVRVYFATQRPSKTLVAKAQAQLDRLLLPSTR